MVELIYSTGRIQGKRTDFGMFGIWYRLRSHKKWGWPWENGSDGGLGGHAREFGLERVLTNASEQGQGGNMIS